MSRRRIEVQLYRRVFGEGYHAARTYRARTPGGALLAAKVLLARDPVITTRARYHEDVNRGPFARVVRGARKAATIEAPVFVVPSVGEQGWTP